MGAATLEQRFARSLLSLGVGADPIHLLVALSGGLDSTLLLYLLRFRSPDLPLRLTAAHLDHRMRVGSDADAAWVAGLCRAWAVPLERAAAAEPLASEQQARDARYHFLRHAAGKVGADRILTAHHADDQAETVLFRILRGTGLAGLAGIPANTRAGVVRPLLPFWREELEAYAKEAGLAWRVDPTNSTLGPARNRLRLELLPLLERDLALPVRRNLVALSEIARQAEGAWRSLVDERYPLVATEDGQGITLSRSGLRRLDPELAVRIVRRALRRFGIVLDRPGTRSAVTFITDAPSGREFQLPGGLRIHTEFDRARIAPARDAVPDVPLDIELREPGAEIGGEVTLGGRRFLVRGSIGGDASGDSPDDPWVARIQLEPGQFPLRLRARERGDRIRTRAGSRSLKRLLIDRRVPRSERASRPVLVDATGRVLWIAGVRDRSLDATGPLSLRLAVSDD